MSVGKSIWHLGAWNRNFGDWVLFDSIQRNLMDAAGGPLHFVPVDSQRTVFSRQLIEKMNNEADMLLVGGGGLIFNRPEDGSVSGWQFNISVDDLRRIKIPLVVYGVGYNKFPYDKNDFPPATREHLNAVQEKAALFSVRNSGTRQKLVKMGLDPDDIRVVMDAGAFAPKTNVAIPGLVPGRPVIGLNIAGDRPEHRFPEPSSENARKSYETLARALRKIVDNDGAQVLLLPHIVDMDELSFGLFEDIIGRGNIVNLMDALPYIYPPGPVYASFLVGAYAACDLAIGMRGHACIIPYGCGVPVFAFGDHNKNQFFLQDIGMTGRLLRVESILDGSLTSDDIAGAVASALHDRAEVARVHADLIEKRELFKGWNRHVISQIV